MKVKQLALFPESAVYGYVHPVYRECPQCLAEEQKTETVERQDETLDGGDDQ